MKRKVYTLCGPMRFIETALKVQEQLELEGSVVIGLMQSTRREPFSEQELETVRQVHMAKIDMADTIYVVNVGGYIGQSTQEEIAYARLRGKRIEYLVEPATAEK